MRNLIFSLLLLSGVAANAQNFPEFERGDTTFYFLPDYFDQFTSWQEQSQWMSDILVNECIRLVAPSNKNSIPVPVTSQYPAVGMSSRLVITLTSTMTTPWSRLP